MPTPSRLSQRWKLISLAVAAALLAACAEQAPPAAEPPARPVKIFTVEGGDRSAIRRFPGLVEASQRADLAFRVAGTLSEIAVKEGEIVKAGQTLARLDPTDFRIQVEDRQATFDNAARNFERGKELVEEGAISRVDFDRMEARYKTSQAALSAAQQELAYTELKAPFSGQIARRYIDNFEEIQAKQNIFSIQGTGQLDIVIDLPESLVRSLNGAAQGTHSSGQNIPMFVEFEGRNNQRFELTLKEVATKADPETQTFPIRLTMPTPAEFPILPGMTANVTIDLRKVTQSSEVFRVPATAVVADSALDARLWVLNPDDMSVSSRKVKIGRISGSSVEVLEGLNGGEEIISVGAPYLAEGMRVTRMALTEQAVPREDDPS